jgi:hypothetical protein
MTSIRCVTCGLTLLWITAAASVVFGETWISLFNGKNLTGWKLPEGDNGHWKVVDGVIDYDARSEASKGDKCLWTKDDFDNFELVVEWRMKKFAGILMAPIILPNGDYKLGPDGQPVKIEVPQGDSGVFVRGKDGYDKAQVNIWCWPIGSGEIWDFRCDKTLSAATRAACVPKICADKPVGEWNCFDITMKGDRMTVKLNDQRVIDNAQLPGIPAKGPIGLQHHGGVNKETGKVSPASSLIQFRNIRIRPLIDTYGEKQ